MTEPQASQTRLDFVGLDAAAMAALAELGPHVTERLRPALDRFYGVIAKVPSVSKMFANPDVIDHARSRQQQHWTAIAAGRLDQDYFAEAHKVGLVHARIGLEPRWYIGGYSLIVEELFLNVLIDAVTASLDKRSFGIPRKYSAGEVAAELRRQAPAMNALIKAVLLDVEIAVSSYFDSLTEESRRLSEQLSLVVAAAADGDFTRRVAFDTRSVPMGEQRDGLNRLMELVESSVASANDVLEALAKADLTSSWDGLLKGSLGELQASVNAVTANLGQVVSGLSAASRGVKLATSEILAGANDLSERTTRQAATIEETSAAMERIAGTVRENAEGAEKTKALADEASAAAEATGSIMREAVDAMGRISASSGKISDIIGMIDNIAFQTNLLALNASVEAARAGEAGKGFAVVAVEVRRLAQSAAQASSEVKALIEQSGAEVKSGTVLVGKAGSMLDGLMAMIKDCAAKVGSISQASADQAGALVEVNIAVRQMDEMTQHNAALVEETNAAIEQTQRQADELDQIVARFKVDRADREPMRGEAARSRQLHLVRRSSAGNAVLRDEWAEY